MLNLIHNLSERRKFQLRKNGTYAVLTFLAFVVMGGLGACAWFEPTTVQNPYGEGEITREELPYAAQMAAERVKADAEKSAREAAAKAEREAKALEAERRAAEIAFRRSVASLTAESRERLESLEAEHAAQAAAIAESLASIERTANAAIAASAEQAASGIRLIEAKAEQTDLKLRIKAESEAGALDAGAGLIALLSAAIPGAGAVGAGVAQMLTAKAARRREEAARDDERRRADEKRRIEHEAWDESERKAREAAQQSELKFALASTPPEAFARFMRPAPVAETAA